MHLGEGERERLLHASEREREAPILREVLYVPMQGLCMGALCAPYSISL